MKRIPLALHGKYARKGSLEFHVRHNLLSTQLPTRTACIAASRLFACPAGARISLPTGPAGRLPMPNQAYGVSNKVQLWDSHPQVQNIATTSQCAALPLDTQRTSRRTKYEAVLPQHYRLHRSGILAFVNFSGKHILPRFLQSSLQTLGSVLTDTLLNSDVARRPWKTRLIAVHGQRVL